MSARRTTHTVELSCVSLGSVEVDLEITGIYQPGEARVDYYPDGSGYPGSPDEFELTEVKALYACGEHWQLWPAQRPDWFAYVQSCAENYVHENWDWVERHCLEQIMRY